ncbi:MAG: inorganic diphosphatase [Xanthobacteraceae bacterium]|uniref:inorganic diphosphatase n=1 Tax=Pseudolabrys sp. TaxID=1960880 RepID=UPI003D0DFF08
MQVFIENEAGAREKKTFDERSLQHLKTAPISAAYPFAYGFVIGTVSGDGDAVDCFVLTSRPLAFGATVACKPIGLLEQIEDGETDHKVIAVPEGEPEAIAPQQEAALRAFAGAVFAHVPGKTMTVGRLLGRDAAENYLRRCRPDA